jgi:glycine cleavage system H protein
MAKATQVFISHDSQDASFAHRLANDLQQLGVRVWIAPDSIRPGEGWVEAINRGLEESSHMVLVLTPAAANSAWVQKETDVAIALERAGRMELIPLDVQPCRVPALWQSYQMVAFRQDYQAGLSRLARRLGRRAPAPTPARPAATPALQEGTRYFTREHIWLQSQRGALTCGLSNYAQEELSDIVYVELPEVGDHFQQGETFAEIESVKAAAELPMPATGRVLEVNTTLYDEPERINSDPYGQGWLIRFSPEDASQLRNLMTKKNYQAYCATLG